MRLALERAVRGWVGAGGLTGLLCILLVVGTGSAHGFDNTAVRTVRLAYLQGEVTILRPDNTGGDPAQLNMPLTEGARVATADDGQAEIEFEDGSVLRVTPQSSVVLTRLGSGSDGSFDTEVGALSGLLYAELRAAPKYAYRIDAGGDVITPVANATIRINLDHPPAEIAVLDGTAEVKRAGAQAGGGFETDVNQGESLREDEAGGGRYILTQQVEHNSWDDWNEEREQVAADELAARTAARNGYAGDQGYGWSDLDANGTWFDAGQGPVWQPFDASVSGFDPYGYGSWVYYTGPGYVWSSGYSWGWTPFRCGSWSYWRDFGWGWRPAGSCGYGGWGAGPGRVRRVNRINLSSVPPGYKRPLPPVAGGPVRVHPILPVRTGPAPTGERRGAYEARQIAGETVLPLATVGTGFVQRGGSAVGSSLRLDFPVDRATGQPVLGLTTAPVGRVRRDAASRPAGPLPGVAGARSGDSGTEAFGANRRQAPERDVKRPVYPARSGVVSSGPTVPVTVRPVNRMPPPAPGVPNERSMPALRAPVRSAPPPAPAPVRTAPATPPASSPAPTSTAPKK